MTIKWFRNLTTQFLDHVLKHDSVFVLGDCKVPLKYTLTLALGKSYIPPPKQLKWNAVNKEFDSFTRRLRIRAKFGTNKYIQGLYFPNTAYTPPEGPPQLEAYIRRTKEVLQAKYDELSFKMKAPAKNIQVQQLEKYLQSADLCSAPADKGLGICIIHQDAYATHIKETLRGSFQQVTEATANSAITSIYNRIVQLARPLLRKDPRAPPENIFKYVTKSATPSNSTTKSPYLIYKVHKLKSLASKVRMKKYPPTRLIVPCHNGITRAASRYLDSVLQPLVVKHIPYLLPDSKTLLKDIETKSFPTNCEISTSDIVALYPCIPISDGLTAMSTFIADKIDNESDRKNILQLFELIMRNNYVTFQGVYYLQTVGTCMGTPCAPIFANVFVHMHERQLMNRYISNGSLLIYRRLIDDVFSIFINTAISKRFWQEYNQINPCIQTTSEQGRGVDYLDLHIYKGSRFNKRRQHNRLDVRLHQKIHNRYAYLPYNSYHPRSCITSWMTSELQRAVRAFSNYRLYASYCQTFYTRLRSRRYPYKAIIKAFTKVSFKNRRQYIFSKHKGKSTPRTIMCVEYNPTSIRMQIGKVVKQHWEDLAAQSTPEWAAPPLIAYRNATNLMGILSKNIPK